MRVAIIGSGIAGLGAAWQLRHKAEVTIFEKQARIGGHSHTVMATDEAGIEIAVDTGFIVYNEATYPNLIALFAALGVETALSDMSFAASLDNGQIEYNGDTLPNLIGSWPNFFRLGHWRMLIDLVRFLKDGAALSAADPEMSLAQYLNINGYSSAFRDNHLLPMAGAIWSSSPQRILDFPARSFGDFFRNHGLLELDVNKRPLWRTVQGGSKTYIDLLAQDSGAKIVSNAAIERVSGSGDKATIYFKDGTKQDFDQIVIATHADEALVLLSDASDEVRSVLQAFRYSANETYLHSDEMLMPRRKRLWASWNYMRQINGSEAKTFVSYWMNRLQPLDTKTSFFVTLNPPVAPASDKTILNQIYYHPQFDATAIAAQAQLRSVQGKDRIWLCGSYSGFGFHEDALASGLAVAAALGCERAWNVKDVSPAFANATPLATAQ